MMALITKLILMLPGFILNWMAGGQLIIRDRVLDPRMNFIGSMAKKMAANGPANPSVEDRRTAANEGLGMLEGKPRPMKSIEHRTIPGPFGETPVRIYTPNGGAKDGNGPLPLMVYYHQGGCVIGNPQWCETFCTYIADEAKAVVISVDYQKAPEKVFPASYEDALSAYYWAHDNAASLGADPDRMGIGGDSAGGNLSAAITHELKKQGKQQPLVQLLIYPWTTTVQEPSSREEFGACYPLDKPTMDFFKEQYLPDAETMVMDHRCSPLDEADCSGLAPAIIATAGFDPITDEGEMYAQKLKAAGVPVAFKCYTSLPHSFTAMSGVLPAAKQAITTLAQQTAVALNK